MAQLKSTVVSGSLRVTDNLYISNDGIINGNLETNNIKSKRLDLFPAENNNFGEGIRIHAADNKGTTLALCGPENTGDSGTSANTWSLHACQGNFYLTRNGSTTSSSAILKCVDNVWSISGTVATNISGSAEKANTASCVAHNNPADLNTDRLLYGIGQRTRGSADGNAYAGSSNNYKLWSYPADYTVSTSSVANIQVLRLGWDANYFHDIFSSPNNTNLLHRAVMNGTAGNWKLILDSSNYSSYALPLSGGTMAGQLVLSKLGYKTNNQAGYQTDAYGNFKHTSTATDDYFCFLSNADVEKVKVYWENGNITSEGNITALSFNGNATSATDSMYLKNSGGRIASADTAHNAADYGRVKLLLSTGSMTTNKPQFVTSTEALTTHDGYILDFQWDNNGDYRGQLAITNSHDIGMSIRGKDNGSAWSTWYPVLTASNYTSYTVTKTGTGASGTWGINISGYSTTVLGSYTNNGGQQNPNYFGKNRVGFLMMNTSVNGNANYKDWLIMDCYDGNDVGGGVAFGINRQALGAYIMRSDAARTSWAQSAELLGTHNYSSYALPKSGGALTGAVTFANNTLNLMGDDCYIGDINKTGHIGIKGNNGNTGLFFITYNQSNNATGGAITWDGAKFNITGTVATSISGNAATASSLTSNTSFNYADKGLSWFDANMSAGAAVQKNDAPVGGWWHILRFNHQNTNAYYTDLAVPLNTGTNLYLKIISNGSVTGGKWYKIWKEGDAITGAVWNDYAEYRAANTTEPGYVVLEKGDDTLEKSTERLQHFAGITSDTWGFAQGETETAKTPIAVAGRVLVYTYQNRNNYKPGDCVCTAPNGTVDIMTREEIINYPDRIVGTVSCVPTYNEWGGGDRPPVKINGRIWIKVK